jgi:hypothetical protein
MRMPWPWLAAGRPDKDAREGLIRRLLLHHPIFIRRGPAGPFFIQRTLMETWRECGWGKCGKRFEPARYNNQHRGPDSKHRRHKAAVFCSNRCRQAAYRWRSASVTSSSGITPQATVTGPHGGLPRGSHEAIEGHLGGHARPAKRPGCRIYMRLTSGSTKKTSRLARPPRS